MRKEKQRKKNNSDEERLKWNTRHDPEYNFYRTDRKMSLPYL